MEFKSYADILSLHTQFSDRFQKRIVELRDELPKNGDALIAAKRAAIKQAQAAAANAD